MRIAPDVKVLRNLCGLFQFGAKLCEHWIASQT
jgi:hypothetical protein